MPSAADIMQYQGIIKKCLSSLEKRPTSTMELLSMVESVSRRRAVGLKAMLFFSSFTIVGIFWYYNNRQIQTYDNRMGQSISTDTLDAEMKLESNAPSETLIYTDYTKVLPPSETLIYTDYTKILPEVKKVIDEDVKPIDAMMDTITRMKYIPSSYFDFLENEAEKLNKLAQRHRGKINPSDFYDFYSEMMSYYKSKVDRWTGILERLE